MIGYEEAKKIAFNIRKDIDFCTEFKDAFMFGSKMDELNDGGYKQPVVVMKDSGKVVNATHYYTRSMVIGSKVEPPVEISTINI